MMSKSLQNICVFCGSSVGNKEIYTSVSKDFAIAMIKKGLKLVYGGGNVGIMGVLADEFLKTDVEVIGVIPKGLVEKEVVHPEVDHMIITEDMFSRKKTLMEISDAFVALPGGFGTLDELFEMLVHFQLHIHSKPVAILNINGFFDHLLEFIRRTAEDQFIKPQHFKNIIVESDIDILIERIMNFEAETIDGKWIEHLKRDNVYK